MITVLRTALDPPDLEAEFREDGLARDKHPAGVLAVVAFAFLLVTVPGALTLIGDPKRIRLILAIRALDLIAAENALLPAPWTGFI